ncbi:MAG: hypothetical protein ACP5P4_09575 [Steroidobacteraceae bacterium]
MSELVIVITDLYLGAEPETAPVPRGTLAGLETLGRFAHAQGLRDGWRPWAAHWLDLARYAALPVASVAAALAEVPAAALWLAEPLSLTEGVGRVHLERRGRLRLTPAEAHRLVEDFNALYAGSGFTLTGLPSGTLLLAGPAGEPVRTWDPARLPGEALAERLPSGPGAGALRRLGSELEMWLHTHPLNTERAARGAPSLSQLWLWGGGAGAAAPLAGAPLRAEVYGEEAYLAGLARLGGGALRALPDEAHSVLGALSGRALCALEVSEALGRGPQTDLLSALADLDRRWIAPAVAALGAGRLGRLWLLANDRAWCLRRGDLWRRWRRGRTALEALT